MTNKNARGNKCPSIDSSTDAARTSERDHSGDDESAGKSKGQAGDGTPPANSLVPGLEYSEGSARAQVATWLVENIEEPQYLKSRDIAPDLDLNEQQVGSALGMIVDDDLPVDIQRWSASKGRVTWYIEPAEETVMTDGGTVSQWDNGTSGGAVWHIDPPDCDTATDGGPYTIPTGDGYVGTYRVHEEIRLTSSDLRRIGVDKGDEVSAVPSREGVRVVPGESADAIQVSPAKKAKGRMLQAEFYKPVINALGVVDGEDVRIYDVGENALEIVPADGDPHVDDELVTDGGENRNDPARLPTSYSPAIIEFLDETGDLFVAHQRTLDSGWVWVVGWAGSRRKLPPQRIAHVELVETTVEHTGDGANRQSWKQIDDEELREMAREAAGLDGHEQLVTDGGFDPGTLLREIRALAGLVDDQLDRHADRETKACVDRIATTADSALARYEGPAGLAGGSNGGDT